MLESVARLHLQNGLALAGRLNHRVEHCVLGQHEGRQLTKDHVRDGGQIPLALQHAGEPLEVRLEPVLFDVLTCRFPEVADHLVQLVLQGGDLAACLDSYLPRQVALCDRRRHF